MRHLEILVPFGLPPANLASRLVGKLHTPALATLVARSNTERLPEFDPLARTLPHGAWLAYQLGLTNGVEGNNSPPIATAAMQMLGVTPGTGVWFVLNPAHIELGMDQMRLTDCRHLSLTDQESRSLFDTAQPLFAEADKTLLYGDAKTWFVRADDWKDLRTSTPDAACGRNLRHWMPEGESELEWRKLHNDVQMAWHAHPVNAAREQHGALKINALWLWGAASGMMPSLPAIVPYKASYRLSGWMAALGQFFRDNQPKCTAASLSKAPPEYGLLLLDELIEPALAQDWAQWLDKVNELEISWFAPLLSMLKSQQLDSLALHLCHDTEFASFRANRATLRRFWTSKNLLRLLQ